MAKSIRSKRMRKFRNVKREHNKVREEIMLRHAVAGGFDPNVEPVPLLPHQKSSGFSFWSVVDEMKREQGILDSPTPIPNAPGIAPTPAPAAMNTTQSANDDDDDDDVEADQTAAASSTRRSTRRSGAASVDVVDMELGAEVEERIHRPLSASAIKKRKSALKLKRKGVKNTKRFNL
ncbi:hypothetical protein CAOG_07202 [Capsaspora owczarzaki ATCC 30864]|uniref:Uncharacterized protein n=1 Tax=Capsaspora owczarzaki (strain ATCC 30864) TaxID=595528 RepID=A0A0D2VYW7_CAPO3|nr:hypothetical protein CAOG_07202 [Capsaspora owczarzaki ATCC 30864]KJE96962.1 hypothetical protein CAOG_007202 [Capsaspora owczarzaki ATCC 30864]|eukprot:XP_004343926.1 hypothetical protein CAOG_07202 [Capsaspora owczarzaki ATCC 30864]